MSIKTTVVGSYPIPAWLAAMPTAGNLRDAVMVAMKTQELAGVDVVSDGELSRFDVNHPETNGMIEYFVTRLGGISAAACRADVEAFRALPGMGFRSRLAGVVRGPIDQGTLDLPASAAALKSVASRRTKF